MIAQSLEGTWLPEQLAIVKRQVGDWDHVPKQIAACDQDLAELMKNMPAAEAKPPVANPGPALPIAGTKRERKRSSKNQLNFDIAVEFERMAGVDLTCIDGIKSLTVRRLIREAGLDMSQWETENHFVAWIGLAPRHDHSPRGQAKRTSSGSHGTDME